MRFGITQYTAKRSGADLPRFARSMGFDGVEPVMLNVAESDLGRPDVRRALVEAARESGIAISSAGFGCFNRTGGFVKDAPDSLSELLDGIRCASAAGAGVMLVCFYSSAFPRTDADIEKLAAGVRRALPEAKAAGLRLALEVPLDMETLANVVDRERSGFLGVYYDVGNALWLGRDPGSEIRRLGGRILAIHIKDTAEKLGDRHLGRGRGNWKDVAQAVEDIAYDGWLTLETPPGDDEALRRDLEFMKETFR